MGKNCKTPEGYAVAVSTHGEFTFNLRTGKVVRTSLTRDFGDKPVRVDVPEYQRWYRHFIGEGFSCDVLSLGYWTSKEYVPACKDWRKDVMDRRQEDSEYDFGPVSETEKNAKREALKAERELARKVKE